MKSPNTSKFKWTTFAKIAVPVFSAGGIATAIAVPVTVLSVKSHKNDSGLAAENSDTTKSKLPFIEYDNGVIKTNDTSPKITQKEIPSEFEIPADVYKIDSNAFAGAQFAKGFTIPSSVKTLGEGSFINSSFISPIILPSSIETIDNAAFDGSLFPEGSIIPSSIKSFGILGIGFIKIPDNCHWTRDGIEVAAVTDAGHEYKVVKN